MTRAQASCAGRSASLRAFTPVFDGLWTRAYALMTRSSVLGCHNTIGPTRLLRARRSAAERPDELAPVSIELHRPPELETPWQHTALVRMKSGAHCSVGFRSGV
jgi:hypothetical protein